MWDEFLRHFRFCDEEDGGLSDEGQKRKGQKKAQNTHGNEYIKTRKTFWRNSKQLLSQKIINTPDFVVLFSVQELKHGRLFELRLSKFAG